MIVLEKIEENSDNIQELLDKMEQKYFKKYLPAFLGFNQINTVVETNKEFFENPNNPAGFIASDKLLNYELEDCENFIKYFGYGYTKFNYYHCYPKTYTVGKNSRKIEYELRDKKFPTIERTSIFSLTPEIPTFKQQIPRTISWILTPAADAS